MKKAILATKVGMTQIFNETGTLIPVTVLQAGPCVVTQVKTVENDGYAAVQVGFVDKREKLVNKPAKGHFDKAGVSYKRYVRELKLENAAEYEVKAEIKVDIFKEGDKVDASAISKGKGFQGVIKRHGQSRGPETHGSRYHRRPGSMGTMRPMRVLKGKKLAGHMGSETVTIQNLEIIEVCVEDNYILVSGNVPGAKGSLVLIKSAVKGGKVDPKGIIINEQVKETVVDEVSEEIKTEETTTEVTETEEKVEETKEVVEENPESNTTSTEEIEETTEA